MDTLIVVTGPTAVGKTELCLEIASKYNIPIISADSRQMYDGMRIGTAAPTAEQLQAVRHYFIGNLKLADYYNAAMYEQDVISLLGRLFRQGHEALGAKHGAKALMTGGSMMYIDAVCNGIDDIPTIEAGIRSMMKERLEKEGLDALCKELEKLDPQYYEIVDKRNVRRVLHGLEICIQTRKPYSSFRTSVTKKRNFNVVKIVLNRPREELYTRINDRVDKMMDAGLLDEVKALYPFKDSNALNTVGYKELFAYIEGKYTLDEAVERIKGNTRRYARKQLTWFKKYDDAHWYNPDDKDAIMQYISQI